MMMMTSTNATTTVSRRSQRDAIHLGSANTLHLMCFLSAIAGGLLTASIEGLGKMICVHHCADTADDGGSKGGWSPFR